MRRYLSTLACSALLGIGTLCGTSALAGVMHVPDVAATAGVSQGGLDTALLIQGLSDGASGLQFVHGGGGGGGHGGGGGMGGGHGMGGHGMGGGMGGGFHGMGGHGMGGFHGMGGGHFDHGRHFRNDGFFNGGGAFFGFGLPWYPACDPYYADVYGTCYPGYY